MNSKEDVYEFNEVFSQEKLNKIPGYTVMGIDIGSRQGKAVLLHNGKVYTAISVTGFSMQETADGLKDRLLEAAGISETLVDYLVGTGYGRVSIKFDKIANEMLTEISCHGMGAAYLADGVKTILDIGGQDSKIIKIDSDTGKVLNFAMNDKCAAGTGRFLERASELLGYQVSQIGEASLKAEKIHEISSQCVVFAESEIVSARAAKVEPVEILAGVHTSVIGRVKGLFNRIGIEKEVLFTGGVSNNIGMKKALEDMLGFKVAKPSINSVYAGALGAALHAANKAKALGIECNKEKKKISENMHREKNYETEKSHLAGLSLRLDLTSINDAVENAKKSYIEKKNEGINAAYVCAYTPVELLDAAGVRYIRLFHTGNEKEIASGESILSKIACDHTKSIVGGFIEGKLLYSAVNQLYTFYTCSFMNSALRAIQAGGVRLKSYAVPKVLDAEDAVERFSDEIEEFKRDLESFTGETISDEAINASISKYNLARKLLRDISDYRKEACPIISGTEYRQICNAYYYLPVDELIGELYQILGQLKTLKKLHHPDGKPPVRIMLTGGIVTEDDRKILKLLEEDFGVAVVVEDSCSGYAPFELSISENGDWKRAISEGYIGKAPCANMKPLRRRENFTRKLAEEYKPDGVVYYYMQFCPTHGMAKQSIMNELQNIAIPTLDIAGSYSSGDEGQIKTRLEAFVELLEKNRG
jgi:predicted CoA-substrate-specific enzyme activase